MLLLAAAVATIATWVPMRWPTADPASLALLKDTPINCLLLEPQNWSPQFTQKAHEQGIATVGITTQPWDPKAAAHLDAILSAAPAQSSTIPVYPLAPRTSLDFNKAELIGSVGVNITIPTAAQVGDTLKVTLNGNVENITLTQTDLTAGVITRHDCA
jgi:hypothetical protein